MAFMGILFFWILPIIQIIKKLMIMCSAIFLVVGLLLLKTHPIITIILFIFSGLNLLGLTAWKIYKYNFKETIVTSDGEVKIKQSKCLKYEEYVESANIEKINGLLDRYPEMIYYKIHDKNRQTLLFYGLYHCDIDIMQCALSHGKQFNDPALNINSNFLRHFFAYMNRNTTNEIINTVKFALQHGAEVVYEDWNFYEQASEWVKKDNVISPKDEELLELIKKYLPDT